MGKVIGLMKLKEEIARLKKRGKKVVFTNGCFDILHVGHVRLFRKARAAGDVLIVAVNSDASIRKIKGKTRPIVPGKFRMEMLCAIRYIDYVIEFGEDTPLQMIKTLLPDIIVKGADWQYNKVVGREYARVVRVPIAKNFSTTNIIEKIVQGSLKK